MKKVMLSLVVVAAIGFTSCSSDDDKGGAFSCLDAAEDVTAAANAYSEEQSVANCNAYKAALQEVLDEACVTGENATATQAVIDSLNCNE